MSDSNILHVRYASVFALYLWDMVRTPHRASHSMKLKFEMHTKKLHQHHMDWILLSLPIVIFFNEPEIKDSMVDKSLVTCNLYAYNPSIKKVATYLQGKLISHKISSILFTMNYVLISKDKQEESQKPKWMTRLSKNSHFQSNLFEKMWIYHQNCSVAISSSSFWFSSFYPTVEVHRFARKVRAHAAVKSKLAVLFLKYITCERCILANYH